MKHVINILVIFLIIGIFSCSKEDQSIIKNDENVPETVNQPYEVIEGTLYFSNYEVFDSMVTEFNKKDRMFLDNWEEQIGLTSTRYIFEKSFDELDKIESDDEYFNELENYKDKLHINEDGSIDYLLGHDLYATFINMDGKFYIGKNLYFFQRNKTIVIEDGDESKIEEALNMDTSCEECGIYVTNEIPCLKGGSNCGKIHGDEEISPWQDGYKYRIIVELKTESYNYTVYEYSVPVGWVSVVRTYEKVSSHRRKAGKKKWRSRKTRFYLRNAYFKYQRIPDRNSTNDVSTYDFVFDKSEIRYPLSVPRYDRSCPTPYGVKSDNSARSMGGTWLRDFNYRYY